MSRIFADNAQSIGNTPLVQINRIAPRGVTILAKIEGRNPGYSVKCRIGANMIWDAEASGRLKSGMTLVEPTSGNTGIGLAFVAAARGYKLILTMPASMSLERRKVLKALGAEIQGIGAGFVPKNLDLSLVDRVEKIGDDEAKNMALRLMQEEGILCGISSGAAMAAAVRLAEEPNMQGKTIVVILPDSGERYLSSMLFDGLFSEQELTQ